MADAVNNFIVEINYVCADFIGDSITKITSNKGRGPKVLSRIYLENCEVYEVDTWSGLFLRFQCVGVRHHGVTFNLGTANVCSPAIFETYFFYDKDIWIVATDYYMYFYLIVLFPLTAILQLIILQLHNF